VSHPSGHPDSYVRAALRLQGYEFTEAQIAEITAQFARIEAVAQSILEYPLAFAAEAAPVFRP
jgi:alkylhydroperoxidase family enzyme